MKKIVLLTFFWSISFTFFLCFAATLPDYSGYKQIYPDERMDEAGTLILSNSPETVLSEGILYQDNMSGKGRLVFHYVNAMGKADKKLLIVIRNVTDQEILFQVDRAGYAPPKYNYLEAGNILLNQYYHCDASKVFFVKPGECQTIYDSSCYDWKEHTVLSGMLDVSTTGKVKISFGVVGRGDSSLEIEALKPLEKDLAPRGTFLGLVKHQSLCISKEAHQFFLIEDEARDWVIGKDAMTGKDAVNYGNYGVLYKIKLVAEADTIVFVCPRGGIFQGTLRWESGEIISVNRSHAFKVNKEPVIIGEISQSKERTLEYILPNGSAAPILIGFQVKKPSGS